MKLKIEKLAHIKEATIEDDDLVVLIGDNGTGKTLILETISFVKNYFMENMDGILRRVLKSAEDQIKLDLNWDILIDNIQNNRAFKDNENRRDFPKINLGLKFNNSDSFNELFILEVEKLYPDIVYQLNKKILFCEQSELQIKLLNLPQITVVENLNMAITRLREDLIIGRVYKNSERNISDPIIINNYFENDDINDKNEEGFIENIKKIELLKSNLEERIKISILKVLYNSYFGKGQLLFLPSERNSFMNSALRKASININSGKIIQRYSEILFDSAYLQYKDTAEHIPELFEEVGKKLVPLFGGKIVHGEDGEIEAILKDDDTLIKRELFSTKQNRFIPFLIIHNPLERYKQIIIEEPEAHLSIKSISELLGYIKELILSNNSIYLTTHSDVFFSRLNNILLTNVDFGVKVYELKSNGKRSVLEEKIRGDYGYEIELFSDELNNLYNETLAIQKQIEEKVDNEDNNG